MDPSVENLTPRHRMLILVAMTGSLAMIMMDTTVVGVALTTIGDELGLGETMQAWVVNAYLLAMASLIALGGRIGDLIGKAIAFRIGVAVFALSSLGCGLSESGGVLVGFRVLQAVGAVLMQPASSAMVVSVAEPGREGRFMGFYIGISMLGLAAGPVLGGIIATHFGWSWIFFINLPIAVFALLMTCVVPLPSLRDREKGLDLVSVGLLVISLPVGIGAIQQAGSWGFLDPRTLTGIGLGCVGLLVFVRRQAVISRPLVNLDLLRDRGFLADAAMLGLMQFALTGTAIQLPILTQATWGFNPQQAGLATLPLVLPVVLLVQVSGRLYDRFGVRPLALPAAVVASAAVVALGTAAIIRSLPLLFAGMFVLGIALPFVNMPANTDGMRRIGVEKRGLASGLLQTVRMTGSTVGVAVIAAIAAGLEFGVGSAEELGCGDISSEVFKRATSGDPKALAEIIAAAPPGSDCVETIQQGISSGIGWGLVVAGLVASLAVVAAFAWRPGVAASTPTNQSRD